MLQYLYQFSCLKFQVYRAVTVGNHTLNLLTSRCKKGDIKELNKSDIKQVLLILVSVLPYLINRENIDTFNLF